MAYTREQIQSLFQSSFNLKEWNSFIENFFKAKEDVKINPTPSPDIDINDGIGYELGYLNTNDGYKIGFFCLKLNKSIDNRKVGLRQLIDKYIKIDADAGVVVFDDGNHWRLSFITDLPGEKTTPKRYSFVFGDGENGYRTAVDRFMDLQRKGISFANIKEAFSVEALTKQFYNDLFDWYTWALDESSGVYFPNNPNTPADDREGLDTKMIRLITRLMFVWFIKQKGLVPDALFNQEEVSHWLKDFDPQSMTSANYYQAILQNLFFATLNRPIKTPVFDKDGNQVSEERRAFAHLQGKQDVKSLYRYQELFKINEDKILSIFEFIPFINGGLFECLDKNKTSDGVDHAYFEDGFSRNATIKDGRWTKRAFVPNKLFFDPEDGIISIFNRYNFTVEENSPSEQQVALDPELLGKVFENLLGVYNPETHDTARSQSGSFYTPREIVNYMVDRSLEAYLGNTDEVKVLFRDDFVYDESKRAFYNEVIVKLKAIKVLDPACGSGAFPIGMLNRIVEIMQNLNAPKSKYDQKLEIMENCIYGGDIQAIAAQITKLRFFISLVCDCKKTDNPDDNYGIPNLPNLETHFVTANSLVRLNKPQQYSLFEQDIIALKEKLKEVRHEHFTAKTVYQKTKLRNRDKELRDELAKMLSDDNVIASEDAKQMAVWNPYDQNSQSPFFDPEWMFGIKTGFDIVIGNPPYRRIQGIRETDSAFADYLAANYKSATGAFDFYVCFAERSMELTNQTGFVNFIMPIKWSNGSFGKGLRDIVSKNKAAKMLINFGAYQVFNASTYTALQWLQKGNEALLYNELTKDLPSNTELAQYLNNLTTDSFTTIPASKLTKETWELTSDAGNAILKTIKKQPRTLGDVFEKIFQGLATSRDKTYFLQQCTVNNGVVSGYSQDLDEIVEIEQGLVRPLLKGDDVHRYDSISTNRVVIFPYKIKGDKAIVYAESEIARLFPKGYEYLKRCEDILRGREKGRLRNDPEWYKYIYPKNLVLFDKEKLVAPDFSNCGDFSYDEKGEFYSTTTLYGYVKFANVKASYKSLLAILNSQVMWYFMKNTGNVMRGGYYRYKTNYVKPFPMPSDDAILKVQSELERWVDIILEKKRKGEQDISIEEQKINEIVFNLYGLSPTERQEVLKA